MPIRLIRGLSDPREAEPRLGAHILDEAVGLARPPALGEHVVGFAAGDLEDLLVADNVRHAEGGDAGLARAHDLARAADLQVVLGDLEAVVRLLHDPQPLARLLRLLVLREEDAVALGRAAPDAPAQLVELREAEALGVLDEHDRGVRHVDADLDDRRRDENLDVAGGEARA